MAVDLDVGAHTMEWGWRQRPTDDCACASCQHSTNEVDEESEHLRPYCIITSLYSLVLSPVPPLGCVGSGGATDHRPNGRASPIVAPMKAESRDHSYGDARERRLVRRGHVDSERAGAAHAIADGLASPRRSRSPSQRRFASLFLFQSLSAGHTTHSTPCRTRATRADSCTRSAAVRRRPVARVTLPCRRAARFRTRRTRWRRTCAGTRIEPRQDTARPASRTCDCRRPHSRRRRRRRTSRPSSCSRRR